MCKDNPLCQSRLCANYTMDGSKVPIMDGVEEILGTMTRYLRELNEMGGDMEDMDDKTKARIRRRSMQVVAEVEDLRDSLQQAIITRLSSRQMEMLGFDAREKTKLDPCQQFAEIEWGSIFSKCFKMSINVRIFKQKLLDYKEDVDVILLSCILTDLSILEIEVEQHTNTVINASTSQDPLTENAGKGEGDNQNVTDIDVTQSNLERPRLNRQISKSALCLASSKCATENKGDRRVKYKKNKTDSLAYALTNPIPIRTARKTSAMMGHRPSEESLLGYHKDKQGTGSNYSINSDLNVTGSKKQSQTNLQTMDSKSSVSQRKKSLIDSVTTLFKNK